MSEISDKGFSFIYYKIEHDYTENIACNENTKVWCTTPTQQSWSRQANNVNLIMYVKMEH